MYSLYNIYRYMLSSDEYFGTFINLGGARRCAAQKKKGKNATRRACIISVCASMRAKISRS